MATRPVEILALAPKLHELFDGLVPRKENGDADHNERDFLSRSLAAYAIHKLSGADLAAAADSIVDGGDDGGIDSVYYSPESDTLWLVQSKYVHSGLSEPDLGDATKFRTGVEHLLEGNFDGFNNNEKWKTILPQIEAHLESASRVRAVLCYSGLAFISEDRKRLFEALKAKASKDPDDEFFAFSSVNLTTINDWIVGGDQALGVDEVELEIINPGLRTTPHETIYGLISLSALEAMYREHGPNLVSTNLRGFKGSTEVNNDIQNTVKAEAGLFFYFNNGLTAYCDRLELNNMDRMNSDRKRIVARGFAIINGAQTLGSIAHTFKETGEEEKPDGYAFIKIISLEKCEDERAFADRISRTSNFQNQVGLKDFAAAYPLHKSMSQTLALHNIYYHFRIDEDTPLTDEDNFTIDEAVTACACLKNANDCDFVTRVAANRASLLSLEMIYPAEELLRSRHERVFPPDLSARTAWRAVQCQRLVLDAMAANARAATGALKSFWRNAKWIIVAAVFNRLKLADGEELALSDAEVQSISVAVNSYAAKLLIISVNKGFASYEAMAGGQQVLRSVRDFQSIFKQQADCQTLYNALKAEIWINDNEALPEAAAPQGNK